ncbi:MAG: hypothetical protein ABSA94_13740 [Acidobacteriaceae bacterium]|jgi:hypothetical protein
MIKKQSVVALVLFLLIPLVLRLGGMLSNAINPEVAAGHPDYVRNYQRLSLLKHGFFWGSVAVVALLWLLVCLLVIRSKKRSYLWLILAALGPLGFAVLSMLDDRAPAETDRYARFLRKLNWYLRGAWELCTFVIVWMLANEVMVLKRTLMIRHEAATTGVSIAQIMSIRDASGGMWAFAEGNEVIYFVILLYLLRPMIFSIVGHVAAMRASPRAR